VFGACVTDHGHNYVIEVTVGGKLDPQTGMVVNLKEVDTVLRRQFIDAVDHRHLNRDVEFLRGVIPTAENLALAAFGQLEPHLKPARLLKVRVVETENNAAEVTAG
jgi:6-pyruvoyltetrahydropterin/6-carboxytetrahydropterin synthase